MEHVRLVRRYVNSIIGDSPETDSIRQVASELSANAIGHSRSGDPGGQFRLEVCGWDSGTFVMVIDQGGSDSPPGDPEQGLLDEHGRGLVLVSRLATRWGWSGDRTGRVFLALFLDHQAEEGEPC
jgi:anti-sigma regulatory factor (Ser/Thr protein kinase)